MNKIIPLLPAIETRWSNDPIPTKLLASGKLLWLQRLLLKLLVYLGAKFRYEQIGLVYNPIYIDDQFWAIREVKDALAQYAYVHPKYLLCGRNFLIDLMKQAGWQFEPHGPVYVTTIEWRSDRKQYVWNMEVIVIPWMEGFLVLPDLPVKG